MLKNFIYLPKSTTEPIEYVNLDQINGIQIFDDDKVTVHFSHGKSRDYHGERAKTIVTQINKRQRV